MKYVLYIDFANISYKNGWEYKLLESANIVDAIIEADRIREEMKRDGKTIFLTRIMKKIGSGKDGIRYEDYEAILCRRGTGWHKNDRENSESYHAVRRWYAKDYEFYCNETIS